MFIQSINEENIMSERYEPSGEYPDVSVHREDALDYLNELRDSGEVNMLAAGCFLEWEFDINRNEAKKLILWWMS